MRLGNTVVLKQLKRLSHVVRLSAKVCCRRSDGCDLWDAAIAILTT